MVNVQKMLLALQHYCWRKPQDEEIQEGLLIYRELKFLDRAQGEEMFYLSPFYLFYIFDRRSRRL